MRRKRTRKNGSITPAKKMERVSAWWNSLPKQTRKRTRKGVLAAAAALGGVLATGGAICVAVDCSPALQRHILATFVDRGTQTRVTISPTATLQWDRAEFALWRGRVTLHNVTYEARKHERTNELFLCARASRVSVGLRPVFTLRRLLRYVDVTDLDATLDLRPPTTFLRSKSVGNHATDAEQHPALSIDEPQPDPPQDMRKTRDRTPVKNPESESAPCEERTDFNIGLLRIRNATLNLITPFVFVSSASIFSRHFLTVVVLCDQIEYSHHGAGVSCAQSAQSVAFTRPGGTRVFVWQCGWLQCSVSHTEALVWCSSARDNSAAHNRCAHCWRGCWSPTVHNALSRHC